ncbi:MAG: hypothetical protein IE912_03205 [Brevundimonas diminuta]|nr:hypothetical protein [Brevundimonas diminuta]MBD3817909.1 hypothetical protein [Brevundimonas diminuta]
MTRLKATPEQATALERRRLTDRAALIRGRVEATPGCGLMPKVCAVENRMRLLQFGAARQMMNEIDDTLEEQRLKAAAEEARRAGEEQDDLLQTQGIDTARTSSGAGARHGLLWLIQKGRLTPMRKVAGQRWSDDYSLVRSDGVRSCLNDNVRGPVTETLRLEEKRAAAQQRLEAARGRIRQTTGSDRLADLLDAVCGRGSSLRALAGGDKVKAAQMEAELGVALDMAAVSYEIVRVAA